MNTLNRISSFLFLGLVASIPFEMRWTIAGLSNLQWVFVLASLSALPGLAGGLRDHVRNRLWIATAALVTVYALSAFFAAEFASNAAIAAVRIGAGLVLVTLALGVDQRTEALALRVWSGAAILAAVFALSDLFGWIGSDPFRTETFYIGPNERLSGSFEYPTTAAAYFAMSLPLVWLVPSNRWVRLIGTSLVWLALVLTYSRGAMLAVVASILVLAAARSRRPGGPGAPAFIAIGAVLFAASAVAEPLLVTRLLSPEPGRPFSAQYELAETGFRYPPSTVGTTPVTLTNNGQVGWNREGPDAVVLMSRWFHVPTRRLLERFRTDTPLPGDLDPGEEITLDARFVTPAVPGEYYLIWDLRTGDDWFSRLRVPPTFAETEIATGAEPSSDQRDLGHLVPTDVESLDASVSRPLLWAAAGHMFGDRPLLGAGGDNFRLLYGTYLDHAEWDRRIRANSLYLEILATTGLLGLGAFIAVAGSISWTRGAVSAAIGVFLIHGLVDVFLMSTPIYFAFWLLAGLSRKPDPDPANEPAAPDTAR